MLPSPFHVYCKCTLCDATMGWFVGLSCVATSLEQATVKKGPFQSSLANSRYRSGVFKGILPLWSNVDHSSSKPLLVHGNLCDFSVCFKGFWTTEVEIQTKATLTRWKTESVSDNAVTIQPEPWIHFGRTKNVNIRNFFWFWKQNVLKHNCADHWHRWERFLICTVFTAWAPWSSVHPGGQAGGCSLPTQTLHCELSMRH